MADSTPTARPIAQGDVVVRLFGSIDDCAVFHEALDAYGRAHLDVNSGCDENSLQRAAVAALDQSATALVSAAADYYCAHTLFDIFSALDAARREHTVLPSTGD